MSSRSNGSSSNFTSAASYGYGARDPSVAATMQRPNRHQATTGSASSQTMYGAAPSIHNSGFGYGSGVPGNSYALMFGATPTVQQTQNNWSGRATIFPNSLLGSCPSIVIGSSGGGQGQVVPWDLINMFGATPSTQVVQQNYGGNWVNSLTSNHINDAVREERIAIQPVAPGGWANLIRNTE